MPPGPERPRIESEATIQEAHETRECPTIDHRHMCSEACCQMFICLFLRFFFLGQIWSHTFIINASGFFLSYGNNRSVAEAASGGSSAESGVQRRRFVPLTTIVGVGVGGVRAAELTHCFFHFQKYFMFVYSICLIMFDLLFELNVQ